ncbi:MAG: NADH-quinone oxidoreductase subunit J [Verrucomicrobia bacterium]|nr:NADH-quinone oxidoreductase subunit J [Verrucomicrobiota bacterium]
MLNWLFIIFATMVIVPALLVATNRNPVNAAMNMIVSFVGLAAMFVLLETYLLAILQVLVYAGAIVVLFLFIIMLIDAEHAPRPKVLTYAASLVALAILSFGVIGLVNRSMEQGGFADISVDAPAASAYAFGVELFTRHILPFQIAGFMLLIAMIGVIVICRRELDATGTEETRS